MPEVIAFAGPCLPAELDETWRELTAGVDLRPPARRGDVLAALTEGVSTLVLLDGYYYTVPAITHQELLYALDSGVRILGAASMGALRAAELEPFGMEGVGRIFEWYRDGTIDGDDEVAILHAPAEDGYRPLTLALVDVRHALEGLVAESTAEADGARTFLDDLMELPFVEREPGRVAEIARRHLGAGPTAALEDALARSSLKRDDARRALERALEPAPVRAPRRHRATVFLNGFREEHTALWPSGDDGGAATSGETPTLVAAWNTVQLLHPATAAFVARARRRQLLAAAALAAGLAPDPERLETRVRDLSTPLSELGWHLPEAELREEAEVRELAERAREHFGGETQALAAFAEHLGFRGEPIELAELLDAGPRRLPCWWLARSFAWTPALAPAREAAAAAAEIERCFERWARGRRVVEADLIELAAEIWGCGVEEVPAEARRRALDEDDLRATLERHAAAEHLPRAINAYPEARARLLNAVLSEDPGPARRAAPAPPEDRSYAPPR